MVSLSVRIHFRLNGLMFTRHNTHKPPVGPEEVLSTSLVFGEHFSHWGKCDPGAGPCIYAGFMGAS